MNRWTSGLPRWHASLFLFLALWLPGLVGAQSMVREAPADVRHAQFRVVQAPVIEVDGKADRLSPGARIRDPQNMLVLSAGLSGQTHSVLYRRDAMGLVHEVWLLTPQEAARFSGGDTHGARLADLIAQLLAKRR